MRVIMKRTTENKWEVCLVVSGILYSSNCSGHQFCEVFRRKIPSYTCKNPITAGDFRWIFARNYEGTE